jgi:hypothetical protein
MPGKLSRFIRWFRVVFLPPPFNGLTASDHTEPEQPAKYLRRTYISPIRFEEKCIRVNTTAVQRLDHIRMRAAMLRDELDALADEACELLDIDPGSCSVAADFARDIVDSGADIGHTIEQVARHKRYANEC